MNDKTILSAESVTEGHPDKLCDTIADNILDACLKNDPESRVACEVLAARDKILVAGEITTAELPDIPHLVCKTVREIGYGGDYEVEIDVHEQSEDIANAVDCENELCAGDQSIVYGYACHETKELLPRPVVLAHRLTKGLTEARKSGKLPFLLPDGKSMVSVEYEHGRPKRVHSVTLSCQHQEDVPVSVLREAVFEAVVQPAFWDFPLDEKTLVLINPSGRFVEGGFDADTGLTGRKLMVDTYGGLVPHGGGAFSGKDATKADRSGAYLARYIAKNLVFAGIAEKCTVCLTYAIGEAEPITVQLDTHGTGAYPEDVLRRAIDLVFDLTPAGMISTLRLTEPMFSKYCNYGHFTHPDAPWEQTDCSELLWDACEMAAGGWD